MNKPKISSLEGAAIYGSSIDLYRAAKRVLDTFASGHNPTESQLDRLSGCIAGFEYHFTPETESGDIDEN